MGPARKVALGVSMLPSNELATYNTYKAEVGVTPALWSIWSDWGYGNSAFPTGPLMDALEADHTVPVIIWQPVGPNSETDGEYSRYNLITGYTKPNGTYDPPHHDAYIKQFARDARDYGHPVLLRFAHEMDGFWFPWGMGRFDNNSTNFIKAWKHIWKLFKNVGATNVRFYWSPLSPNVKEHLYPGNKYVSYIGFTAFNWNDPARGGWLSMVDAFKTVYGAAIKVSTKPIIVAETGSAPGTGTKKAKWITNGYAAVYTQMTAIKGIIYFNVDMRLLASQPDWRVTPGTSKGFAAWIGVVNQTNFQGTIT